mmetsp:Transcript_16261/g.24653  ORF Transcript_16261/g.24653 Transcript_16261/m.24653 type:complete len:116 (-) Transcript_16261:1187-1534(-)
MFSSMLHPLLYYIYCLLYTQQSSRKPLVSISGVGKQKQNDFITTKITTDQTKVVKIHQKGEVVITTLGKEPRNMNREKRSNNNRNMEKGDEQNWTCNMRTETQYQIQCLWIGSGA